MRKVISFGCMLLWWPLGFIHRIVKDLPDKKVNWIIFDPSIYQSEAWYWCDTGRLLSTILFIFGVWLVIKKAGYYFYVLTSAFLAISVIDLFHYWGWYSRNDTVVFFEGVIMIAAGVKIYLYLCKPNP